MTEPTISKAAKPEVVQRKVRRSWIVVLTVLAVCLAGSQLHAVWQTRSQGVADFGPIKRFLPTNVAFVQEEVQDKSLDGFTPAFNVAPQQPELRPLSSSPNQQTSRRQASAEFDNEQRQFESEIQNLRNRIKRLESRLTRRAKNRDRLIDQKVKQRQAVLNQRNSPTKRGNVKQGFVDSAAPRSSAPTRPRMVDPSQRFNRPSSNAVPDPFDSPPLQPRVSGPDEAAFQGLRPSDPFEDVRQRQPDVPLPSNGFSPFESHPPEQIPDQLFPDSIPAAQPELPDSDKPGPRPYDDGLVEPAGPATSNSSASATVTKNSSLITALHARFRDLRSRMKTANNNIESTSLQQEASMVTKLAALQLVQLENRMLEPKRRIEQFMVAEARLKEAGVKDPAVLNGLSLEWKKVADSIKQLQVQVDQAKAPFFERTVLLSSGDISLKQFTEILERQTGITFRLGTSVDGEKLTPLRDSIFDDELFVEEQVDAFRIPNEGCELQLTLKAFLNRMGLTHRNEINPASGELICVIVYRDFKFKKEPLENVLQIFAEAMGVGYELEQPALATMEVTHEVTDFPARLAFRQTLDALGLAYRVEPSTEVLGGEMFKIFKANNKSGTATNPDLEPEQDSVPNPDPGILPDEAAPLPSPEK